MTKVRMLDSETGRLKPGEAPRQFIKGEIYDVPEAIAVTWVGIALAERVAPEGEKRANP